MLKDDPKKDWRKIALMSLTMLVYVAASLYAVSIHDMTMFNTLLIIMFIAGIALNILGLSKLKGEQRGISIFALFIWTAAVIAKVNETFLHIPVSNEVIISLGVILIIVIIPVILIYGYRRNQRKKREFEYSLRLLEQTEEYDRRLATPAATILYAEQPKPDKLKEQSPHG